MDFLLTSYLITEVYLIVCLFFYYWERNAYILSACLLKATSLSVQDTEERLKSEVVLLKEFDFDES